MMSASLQLFDLFLASSAAAPNAAAEAKTPVDGLAIIFVLILFAILVLLVQFAPSI